MKYYILHVQQQNFSIILKLQIVSHMTKNKLFSKKQFGFISGRSTTLQLLKVMKEWTEILDKGGSIDCVYELHEGI